MKLYEFEEKELLEKYGTATSKNSFRFINYSKLGAQAEGPEYVEGMGRFSNYSCCSSFFMIL